MKTAVIYARYSSDRQTEQSIEGQLRVCNEFAMRNDMIVVDTYIDRATTGTNDNRVEFQKMLKNSNKKAWDVVIVYKLDRFSRNKYETAKNKKILRDNGVKLISAMENIPDTPEGIILESLLEGMAEYYSAELSQKVKRGMNETRQKGNFTGGHIPYGYKVVDKKVVPNEDKANIVRFIYEQCASGIPVKDTIEYLQSNGVMNNGKPIARNTVYNILNNEKYSGIYHFNNEVFDNIYPRLVPQNIFDIVQQKLEDNKYGKRSVDTVYLFRNKITCGHCNSPMSAETGTSKTGKVNRYYKCSNRKKRKGCTKSNVRKENLEELVIDTLFETFNNTSSLNILVDNILQTHKERMRNQSMLNLLLKEKTETESSINNLIFAVEKGIITSSTKRRLDELEILLIDIDNKIVIEKAKLNMQMNKNDILDYIHNALKEEPQQMIELLVKQVILHDDKVEIIYKYTNNPEVEDLDNINICKNINH